MSVPDDHSYFSRFLLKFAEIIAEHSHLEGPTLVILHALQEAFGYVPEAAIPMVASALNLSRAEIHGVSVGRGASVQWWGCCCHWAGWRSGRIRGWLAWRRCGEATRGPGRGSRSDERIPSSEYGGRRRLGQHAFGHDRPDHYRHQIAMLRTELNVQAP